MIGRLVGKVLEKQSSVILLDVNGVGYEVNVPLSTFFNVPEVGTQAVLYTHFLVREDAHTLFGFQVQQERELFRDLIKANGVGPRMALAILSSMDVRQFALSIVQQEIQSLVTVPGIGKKTAERLVVELQEKAQKWLQETQMVGADTSGVVSEKDHSLTASTVEQDAQYALIALGYKPQEAKNRVKRVYKPGCSSEQLIKMALQE